jgi:hypothetical protein
MNDPTSSAGRGRTVERHLNKVFEKLQITSRGDLRDILPAAVSS